jgi:hypothetical protein
MLSELNELNESSGICFFISGWIEEDVGGVVREGEVWFGMGCHARAIVFRDNTIVKCECETKTTARG